MREAEVKELFETIPKLAGKVVYRTWKTGENVQTPDMPYLAFYCSGVSNFAADNSAYFSKLNYTAELYTRNTNPRLEAEIERALTGIFWTKERDYLDGQKCWVATYTF